MSRNEDDLKQILIVDDDPDMLEAVAGTVRSVKCRHALAGTIPVRANKRRHTRLVRSLSWNASISNRAPDRGRRSHRPPLQASFESVQNAIVYSSTPEITGSLTVKDAPFPLPSLEPTTVPPCSSTM